MYQKIENENRAVVNNVTEVVLSDKRKKQIKEIIFQENIQQEAVGDLTIQEIIFSLRIYDYFSEKSQVKNYDQNYKILKDELIYKLQNLEKIYLTIDNNTQFPFLNMGHVDIYSEEIIAKEAAEHYNKQYRDLVIEKTSPKEGNDFVNMKIFEYLYYLGVEHIRIDMGRYSTEIELIDIFDISFQDERPTVSPSLRFAMIDFLEESYWEGNYKNKQDVLLAKESKMLEEVKHGTYLVPVQFFEGKNDIMEEDNINFPILKSKEDVLYLPIFTDWVEFEKKYDKNEWKGMIADYDKIKFISKQNGGVIINPLGENIAVSQENLNKI